MNQNDKKILLIPGILIIMFIIVVYYLIKGNPIQEQKDYKKLKNSENEALFLPTEMNSPNSETKVENKIYSINSELEKIMENWNDIFDIFIYNRALHRKNALIYKQELEKISEKVGKIKSEFDLRGVDEIVKEYKDLIISECNRYKMDWRLILAIVHQESLFNPNAVSRAGAFGLMQLMPLTGRGLQNELSLEDTKTPRNNLTAGMYYYATLVANFEFAGEDKFAFALAAYNAGFGRVVDAMTMANFFGKDYKKWDNVKDYYPYLASSQDSIHKLVWPTTKRPPSGCLNNWLEPYQYVSYVLFYWGEYKKYFEPNLPEDKPKKLKKKNKK